MKSLLKRMSESLKINNQLWKKRAGFSYAIGVWTVLGVVFLYAGNPRNIWKKMGQPIITPGEDNEEEQERKNKIRKEDQKKRSQASAEYVAENVYTPLDFMA